MPSTYIAFDHGIKRIGVALGDDLTQRARALPTLASGDWEALRKLIEQWRPQALVVGLPLREDGSDQPATQAARGFAAELHKRHALPVHFADERYSSLAADDWLRDARASGRMARRVRKGDRDAQAARVILEQWLAECR